MFGGTPFGVVGFGEEGGGAPDIIHLKGDNSRLVVDPNSSRTWPAVVHLGGDNSRLVVDTYGLWPQPAIIHLKGDNTRLTVAPVGLWPQPASIHLKGDNSRLTFDPAGITLQSDGIHLHGDNTRLRVDRNANLPIPAVHLRGDNSRLRLEANGIHRGRVMPSIIHLNGDNSRLCIYTTHHLHGDNTRLRVTAPPAQTMDAAYCYHLDKEGIPVTRFSNFHFLRVIRIKGRNIGYTRTGRYLLGGTIDGDTRINSSFTLASHNFGSLFMKRCPWLHYHGDHGMRVTVRVGGEDGSTHGPYTGMEYRPNQGRVQLGGGIVAGLWSFKIDNIAGQPLKIGWLEPDFITLGRRI